MFHINRTYYENTNEYYREINFENVHVIASFKNLRLMMVELIAFGIKIFE